MRHIYRVGPFLKRFLIKKSFYTILLAFVESDLQKKKKKKFERLIFKSD